MTSGSIAIDEQWAESRLDFWLEQIDAFSTGVESSATNVAMLARMQQDVLCLEYALGRPIDGLRARACAVADAYGSLFGCDPVDPSLVGPRRVLDGLTTAILAEDATCVATILHLPATSDPDTVTSTLGDHWARIAATGLAAIPGDEPESLHVAPRLAVVEALRAGVPRVFLQTLRLALAVYERRLASPPVEQPDALCALFEAASAALALRLGVIDDVKSLPIAGVFPRGLLIRSLAP